MLTNDIVSFEQLGPVHYLYITVLGITQLKDELKMLYT